jgi:hypothetical protein
MEPIEPRFKRWIPLEVEWPEDTVGDASDGQPVPIAELPDPVTAPAMPVTQPEPVTRTVVAVLPESSQPIEVDGIIWDIEISRP